MHLLPNDAISYQLTKIRERLEASVRKWPQNPHEANQMVRAEIEKLMMLEELIDDCLLPKNVAMVEEEKPESA